MTDTSNVAVSLDRDLFMRALLRELTGTLEEVVGVEEAEGYISVVGRAVGSHIDRLYKDALQVEKLSRQQVGAVLVGLKRRIEGDFFVIEETEDRIVLGNRRCPFGEFVKGRSSLCMMTSNIFGLIAAENLGYAGVELKETIAEGHSGCLVVVHLRPQAKRPAKLREYFKHDAAP